MQVGGAGGRRGAENVAIAIDVAGPCLSMLEARHAWSEWPSDHSDFQPSCLTFNDSEITVDRFHSGFTTDASWVLIGSA